MLDQAYELRRLAQGDGKPKTASGVCGVTTVGFQLGQKCRQWLQLFDRMARCVVVGQAATTRRGFMLQLFGAKSEKG